MHDEVTALMGRRTFCTGAAAGFATLAVAPAFRCGAALTDGEAADGAVKTPLLLDTKRMAIWDGPGIRTTFFVKGCPLRCIWCHNPESLDTKPRLVRFEHLCVRVQTGKCPMGHCTGEEDTCPTHALKHYGQKWTLDALVAKALEDKPFYDRSGGGVTLSGGEPLYFWRWSAEFLKRCKAAGLHTCLDTSLYAPPAAVKALMPHVDMWLADYKADDDERHRKFTGVSNAVIRKNLKMLVDAKAKVEVRCLVVPNCTDGADIQARHTYLDSLGLKGSQIVDLEYFDYARSKYRALGLKDTMPAK